MNRLNKWNSIFFFWVISLFIRVKGVKGGESYRVTSNCIWFPMPTWRATRKVGYGVEREKRWGCVCTSGNREKERKTATKLNKRDDDDDDDDESWCCRLRASQLQKKGHTGVGIKNEFGKHRRERFGYRSKSYFLFCADALAEESFLLATSETIRDQCHSRFARD